MTRITRRPPALHDDPHAAAYQVMLMLAAMGADPDDPTPINQLLNQLWDISDHLAHRYCHQLAADVTNHWPDRQAIATANTHTAERYARIYQHHTRNTRK